MSENSETYDFRAKVLLVGDPGVGKTSPVAQSSSVKWLKSIGFGRGFEYVSRTVEVNEKKIKFLLFEMPGQKRYAVFLTAHSKGTTGIMLCYAVDDRKSFENIDYWMKQIKAHIPDDDICILLVGLKSDVSGRVVDVEEGRKLANFYGIKFFEISIKEELNVESMFLSLAEDVLGIIERIYEREKDSIQAGILTKECGCCSGF